MKGNFRTGVVLCLLMPLSIMAAPGLDPVIEIALPDAPATSLLADIDQDGVPDFVIAAHSAHFYVRFGAGGGSIDGSKAVVDVALDTPFHVFTTGDFDADGYPDVAGVHQGENEVSVWLNVDAGGGARAFVHHATLLTGNGVEAIAVANLDGDGSDDLVVANSIDDTLSVFINTAGTFGAGSDIATDDFPVALESADIDNDADSDLLVLNAVSGTLQAFLNTAGTLGLASTTQAASVDGAAAAAFPIALAVADVNSDTHADVVIANLKNDEIYMLSGDGLGEFSGGVIVASHWHDAVLELAAAPSLADPDAAVTFAIGDVARIPRALAFADVTGDGNNDLVVTALANEALRVFPADGLGGFESLQVFATPEDLVDVQLLDLDADGHIDASAIGTGALHVMLNQELANRAPVVLNRSLRLQECTQQEFSYAHDVDGDELIFGDIAITSDHPVGLLEFLPALEIATHDTGDAATLTVANLVFTVTDGVAESRQGALEIVVEGDGAPGDCEAGAGLTLGSLQAEHTVSISSMNSIDADGISVSGDVITLTAEGSILGSVTIGGSSGGSGSSGGVLTLGELLGTDGVSAGGTITINNAGDLVTVSGELNVVTTDFIVVVHDGSVSIDEDEDADHTGNDDVIDGNDNVDGEDLGSDQDDETDTATGGGSSDAENETSGGGAWFWLGLPLLFLRRRN